MRTTPGSEASLHGREVARSRRRVVGAASDQGDRADALREARCEGQCQHGAPGVTDQRGVRWSDFGEVEDVALDRQRDLPTSTLQGLEDREVASKRSREWGCRAGSAGTAVQDNDSRTRRAVSADGDGRGAGADATRSCREASLDRATRRDALVAVVEDGLVLEETSDAAVPWWSFTNTIRPAATRRA